jgi:predicted ABC-type sugar transport system permease subunit
MLSPRGYSAMYALEIVSHRLLRYASPFMHIVALAGNIALIRRGRIYVLALLAQLGVLAATVAPLGRASRVARYYVLMTASQGLGLWDHLRGATTAGWEKAEGTR